MIEEIERQFGYLPERSVLFELLTYKCRCQQYKFKVFLEK